LLEKTVRFRLNKILAHPHFEHQYSPILGVRLEKKEKIPYEFPDFVESAGNSLKMQFQLASKLVRFFYGYGEKQIFLIPEILIDRTIGDTRLLSYFGNICSIEIFFAEDFNRCSDDGFSSIDLLGHDTRLADRTFFGVIRSGIP
jgi:hypothetical protein